jgi:hypothetical protein
VAAGFELGVGEDVGSGCHPVNRHSYALKQRSNAPGSKVMKKSELSKRTTSIPVM